MGYRKIEPRIVHIDELSNECGLSSDTVHPDNPYGCCSRSKLKEEPLRCFAFDCPLGPEADLEDMKSYDWELWEQWKDSRHGPIESGAEYVLQCREVV